MPRSFIPFSLCNFRKVRGQAFEFAKHEIQANHTNDSKLYDVNFIASSDAGSTDDSTPPPGENFYLFIVFLVVFCIFVRGFILIAIYPSPQKNLAPKQLQMMQRQVVSLRLQKK